MWQWNRLTIIPRKQKPLSCSIMTVTRFGVLPMERPRSRLPLALAFLQALVIAYFPPATPVSAGPLAADVIQVFLSPNGGAAEAVVRELGNAKKEILVQAYPFTSAPIAKALVDAHKRGVKITVLLDASQREDRDCPADFSHNAGIPTYIDDRHAIADKGIMIIDRTTILTRSPDFTKGALERDAEILLVIKANADLVKEYLACFKDHLEHSERYVGRD
jgi:phosphatidylserine/phosphatidylglycerophosphate/cardiolipin synthase-like enzyme